MNIFVLGKLYIFDYYQISLNKNKYNLKKKKS